MSYLHRMDSVIFFVLVLYVSTFFTVSFASDEATNSDTTAPAESSTEIQSSNQVPADKATPSTYNFKEEELKYINSWIPMRPVIGTSLFDKSSTTISADQGASYLIFFISSWCTSCKTKIDELKKLQDTHQKLYTKVIYAFSHDTYEDALAFSKKHDIQRQSILVNDATIGAYSNPHIPSIFIVDRHSWIIDAYDSLDSNNLKDIDEILNLINSY